MEGVLVNGILALLGICVGALLTFVLSHKRYRLEIENIRLQNEMLNLQIVELQQKNKQLEAMLVDNTSEDLRKYLLNLTSELSLWQGGLGLGRTIELKQIYVSVDLKSVGKQQGEEIGDFELLNDLVENKDSNRTNALIIGGAGSGKSTLMRRWAFKIANDSWEKFRQEKQIVYIPIFIPLNIIGQLYKTQINFSWKIAELALKHLYGLSDAPAKHFLAFLEEKISQGKALIFLDAADEVPENMQELTESMINSLSINTPHNLIILSSRPIAYADQMKNFERYNMVEFREKQINQFVDNWFSSVKLPMKTKREVTAFINASNLILKSNPLFLTMLCVVVEMGNQKEIPSAGALFERFIHELLEHWPVRVKGLHLNVQKTVLKLLILQQIAYKLFEDHRQIIQEDQLLSEVERILKANPTTKEIDASIIIDDITEKSGILREGRDGFYSFYHPLFLEFFCARKIKTDIIDNVIDQDKWFKEHVVKYGEKLSKNPV